MREIRVDLNFQAIIGRVNRKAEEISRHVSSALIHLPQIGNSYPSLAPDRPVLKFNSGLTWTDDDARAAWKLWILSAGFRDISEIISSVLEEAFGVLTLFKLLDQQIAGHPISSDDWNKRDKDIARFHRLSLTDKLRSLEENHSFQLQSLSKDQLTSINLARNCLTHREGIVSSRDTNEGEELSVCWEGLDFIVVTQGKEIPLIVPMHVEHGGEMHIRTAYRKRNFRIGERVSFDEIEFSEIAHTIVKVSESVARELQSHGQARGIQAKAASV